MADSPTLFRRSSGTPNTKISFNTVLNKASAYHIRIPYLNKLPFAAVGIIVTLIVINLIVWAVVGVVLVR